MIDVINGYRKSELTQYLMDNKADTVVVYLYVSHENESFTFLLFSQI